MKNIIILFSLLISTILFSQVKTEKIHSEKLNEDREITIQLPRSFNTNLEKKYPLILVLDGEYLFAPFEGNITYSTYWDDMPEVLLVGINQNKKDERYSDSELDPQTGLPVNKGGAFFEFIGAELIPFLEKSYKISSFRVIAGLDTTAGFLNSFLYKDIPQFSAYISISPELGKGMIERIPQRLAATKVPLFYYQATADGDLKKFQNDIKDLDKNMATVKNDFLNYKFDDFKSATHYSLALNAIPSALHQIFSIYSPISSLEYQEKIVVLTDSHAKYLNDKYDNIEKLFGIKMNVRLNDFRAIEAAVLKSGDFKGFEELAQVSGQQYEKSMLHDYHMGMYFEKTKNYKRAAQSYQDAFTKEEIRDLTKDMMMNKAADMKKMIPVKPKGLKGGKAKEIITETPATDTPITDTPVTDTPATEVPTTDKPAETPTTNPTEEKKP